jgi:solute carrier family 25 phosphate transporter 23/24/25/41
MSTTDRASLTPKKAEALKLMYENELLGTCGGHVTSNATSPIDWKEFKDYAEAKEVGTHTRCIVLFLLTGDTLELWTIFHDELDLDGNGHLDSEELALALGKAGELIQHTRQLFLNNLCRHNTNAPDVGGIYDNLDIQPPFPCHQV